MLRHVEDEGVATSDTQIGASNGGCCPQRIVEAAVELLTGPAGESGLTFRALTECLATGPGADRRHVANNGERARRFDRTRGRPRCRVGSSFFLRRLPPYLRSSSVAERPVSIRGVALGLFDGASIDAYPARLLATQRSAQPSR